MRLEQTVPLKRWAERLLVLASGSPWFDLLVLLGRLVGGALVRGAGSGTYEVLHYASTLELLDAAGARARFTKLQRVRYLQDDVVAVLDRIWSDGKAPLGYRCMPGVVVDRYRPAQSTILLISLRQPRRRGETEEHHAQWRIRSGFLRAHELWQTTFHHRTRTACIRILFPSRRPPQEVWGVEEGSQRRYSFPDSARQRLADGRWRVQWELQVPRVAARYELHWTW